MIQDAIENMIEISKAKLYPLRSKLIIQDGKQVKIGMDAYGNH